MISIVTSTKSLNKETFHVLERHYASLRDSEIDFELIVQDCQSSPEIVEALALLPFVSVKSECDSGIYDAWNRALPRIKGDKVCFLGVDDIPAAEWFKYADKFTLKEDEALVCDVSYINSDGLVMGTYKNPNSSALDMRVAKYLHPGFIFPAEIYKNRKFKSSYKIISDGLFYSELPFVKIKSHFQAVGVLMTIGGTSNSPAGARKRFYEYCQALSSGDIEMNIRMINRFIVGNLPQYILSFFPRAYNLIQKSRMKIKYSGK